jgi:hypothetical protein
MVPRLSRNSSSAVVSLAVRGASLVFRAQFQWWTCLPVGV